MKKWLSYVLILGLLLACAGCREKNGETPTDVSSVASQGVTASVVEESSVPQNQEELKPTESTPVESTPQNDSSKPSVESTPSQTEEKPSEETSEPKEEEPTFTPTRFDPLSQEKIKEISACVEKDNYEYGENQYFGTYNGYHVLLVSQINGVENEDDTHIKIGGYDFEISGTELLIAYKNYSYIPLTDAYAKGCVSGENMKDIRYWYGKKFRGKFGGTLVCVGIKDPVGDGKKTFTIEDFPEIDTKGIYKQYWYPKWYDDDDPGYAVYLELPIDNQRNVLNVIKILEKMDGVMFAEPDYIILI